MQQTKLMIPVRKLKTASGRLRWPAATVLCSPFAEDALPLGQLAADLRRATGSSVRISRNHLKPHALVVRRHGGFADPEAYRVTITTDRIEILAPSAAAAYYAIQTIRELVGIQGKSLACCVIEDAPDFKRRGVYLDCSRGKVPTVATLKLLVEYLASLKLNELQLYVENVFTFASHPDIGRGFSPFTPETLLAVQDHCRLHHVRFVPSLTSFGHFEKILGLPAYHHLGELPGYRGHPGGTTLCPGDPGAIRLVADMYGDFLPLFEAHDFNACGDEPWELSQGRSKRRAARVGKGRVYLDFIKQLHQLCLKHGKRMNLWSDIVLNHPETIPEIPNDIVMLNWDYSPRGPRIPRTHEFADAGLAVVVCPGTSSCQSHGTRLRNAIDNVRVFAEEGRRNGAEGLLNTDWGDGGHRNPLGSSLHGFAHGAAHAWNGAAVDDATFTATFCRHVFGSATTGLPEAIRQVGASQETVGVNLYHLVGTAIDPARNLTDGIPIISPVAVNSQRIEDARDAGIRKTLTQLGRVRAVLDKQVAGNPIGQLLVEDLALAAELDVVGCLKLQVMQRYRSGKSVSSAAYRQLDDAIGEAAAHLKRNWLQRNRPSRLADNLRMLEAGRREVRTLMQA
jgi:hexosaminidase